MAIRSLIRLNINLVSRVRPLKANRTILSDFNYRTRSVRLIMAESRFSHLAISQNVKLNSVAPLELENKEGDLPKVKTNGSRPMVVLLEYMNAKEKHVKKFVDLYIDFGFDVLQVNLKPWQLLWPTKGSQLVAKEVAQFLLANHSFSPLVIHGFSVGGYLWGEVVVHISRDLTLYQPVIERIKCKIFDSAVDVNDIPKGFPMAVFPKNKILRAAFEKCLRYHLKTFYDDSTRHYIASRKAFSSNIVKCPTLMITSKADPMSSVLVNEAVRQELATHNIECYMKIFESSHHVAHFKKYRDEYVAEIEDMFSRVNIIQSMKLKAKL